VCRLFSVEDLFTAGLGFDLAGAVLLGVGLLVGPGDIARRTGTFPGYNSNEIVSFARSRVDAIAGFSALAIGFICQGAGYAAILGGVGAPRSDWHTMLGAILAALLATALVLAVWRLLKAWAVKRILIQVAYYAGADLSHVFAPSLDRLAMYGYTLGFTLTADEAGEPDLRMKRRFVERVFGVDYAATDDEIAEGMYLPDDAEE
jgi:hypothetical protein